MVLNSIYHAAGMKAVKTADSATRLHQSNSSKQQVRSLSYYSLSRLSCSYVNVTIISLKIKNSQVVMLFLSFLFLLPALCQINILRSIFMALGPETMSCSFASTSSICQLY